MISVSTQKTASSKVQNYLFQFDNILNVEGKIILTLAIDRCERVSLYRRDVGEGDQLFFKHVEYKVLSEAEFMNVQLR
jgi:hypothetical protein